MEGGAVDPWKEPSMDPLGASALLSLLTRTCHRLEPAGDPRGVPERVSFSPTAVRHFCGTV